MRLHKLVSLLVMSLCLLSRGVGHATVLLNDNFDGENGGVPTLNYSGFANFSIANSGGGGAADLIGNGFADFFPGNGLYVDICGSASACAVLTTKQVFAAGSYTVTLGIAGNGRVAGADDALNMSFGAFSASFLLNIFDQATEVENVTLSAPSALTISDQGAFGPDIGNILLSVKVETVEPGPTPTPEPGTLGLLSLAFAGIGLARRRRLS